MSQMLSIWRGVTEQLTPKASHHAGTSQERNPFDDAAAAPSSTSSSSAAVAKPSRGQSGATPAPSTSTARSTNGPSSPGGASPHQPTGGAALPGTGAGGAGRAANGTTGAGAAGPGPAGGAGLHNGFASSRKVSFPHLHLHHLSAAVSGNSASRRGQASTPGGSAGSGRESPLAAATPTAELHDGLKTPLARSPNTSSILTPTRAHVDGSSGTSSTPTTPGAGGSFFGVAGSLFASSHHPQPAHPADRNANSQSSSDQPAADSRASPSRPGTSRSFTADHVQSRSTSGHHPGGAGSAGGSNMTGLKAPQTTSVSRAGPDFTFKASPISRAKNALRDSVSGVSGNLKGTTGTGGAADGKTFGTQKVKEPAATATSKSPTSTYLRTNLAPSSLGTAGSSSPSGDTSPTTPRGPTSGLADESPVGSVSSSSTDGGRGGKDGHGGAKTHSSKDSNGSALPPPRGQLSIKLHSARNLAASHSARPYVVAAYDNSEFVSREPIAEDESEVRGVAAKLRERKDTTIGTDGKGPPAPAPPSGQNMAAVGEEDRENVHPNRQASLKPNRESNGNGLFCLSGQNPIWKHEVDFDVVGTPKASTSGKQAANAQHPDSRSLLVINIYDRSVGDDEATGGGVEGLETFLGEAEIVLDFEKLKSNNEWIDAWYPLRARGDGEVVRGEVRLQLKYKEVNSRRGLSVDDFDFLKMIGRGTFGRVFQVRKKDTRRIYAMKVLSKKEVIAKKEVQHTLGERNILQRSSECPFLLGLKFSFQSPGELFLVMDYKSGGELFHHLQKEGRFAEDRARFYTAEIVLAFEHLHKYDIVYRDLKPENILLDATGHIVLCDFGLSKPDLPSDALTTTFCGTTEYLAPEVLLDDHGYSKLVDFWSLGVLLFEMCCGWSPFYAEDTQQMYKNICFGKIKFPRGVIGDEGKQFVKGLLNRNPRHRLGAQRDAEELKEHAFFKSIDWVALEARQVAPPFKPFVDSDESVANFDAEFTEADILKEMPMPALDEADRSDDWLKHASVPISSPREMPQHRRRSQDSMSEQFRGFSYAGESEFHLGSSHSSHHSAHDVGFGGSRFAMTSIK